MPRFRVQGNAEAQDQLGIGLIRFTPQQFTSGKPFHSSRIDDAHDGFLLNQKLCHRFAIGTGCFETSMNLLSTLDLQPLRSLLKAILVILKHFQLWLVALFLLHLQSHVELAFADIDAQIGWTHPGFPCSRLSLFATGSRLSLSMQVHV